MVAMSDGSKDVIPTHDHVMNVSSCDDLLACTSWELVDTQQCSLRSFHGLEADANAASESALAPLALLPAAAMAGAPPEALRALQVSCPC